MGAGENVGKCCFCLCGPKGSLCCTVLSIWGVVMLTLLAIFFSVEAVALFEDIQDKLPKITGPLTNISHVTYYDPNDVTQAYQNAATACGVAAVIYFLFLVWSGSFLAINIWRAKIQQKPPNSAN